ncbi:MAG: KEOPS complex subunit Pcc1 [Candidatus Nitrosopolaris sp.]
MTPNPPTRPEISASIQIRFLKRNEMYAVLRSLIPDNINFPKGLSIEMSPRENDNNLLLYLYCNVGFETLLNTLDELLEHISIAQKVISHA